MEKQLQQTHKSKSAFKKPKKSSVKAAKQPDNFHVQAEPKFFFVPPTPPSTLPTPLKPPKNTYLNNRDLLEEVKKSKKRKQMTDKFAKMLQLLCAKYAKKGNFINYTYNEDMQAYALLMLVRTWDSFDPAKSQNAFAFFTQCIKNSFIQYLNQEKRQRVIRDLLLVDQGMSPSFSFKETEEARAPDDEQNLEDQKGVVDLLSGGPKNSEQPESTSSEAVDGNNNSMDNNA